MTIIYPLTFIVKFVGCDHGYPPCSRSDAAVSTDSYSRVQAPKYTPHTRHRREQEEGRDLCPSSESSSARDGSSFVLLSHRHDESMCVSILWATVGQHFVSLTQTKRCHLCSEEAKLAVLPLNHLRFTSPLRLPGVVMHLFKAL